MFPCTHQSHTNRRHTHDCVDLLQFGTDIDSEFPVSEELLRRHVYSNSGERRSMRNIATEFQMGTQAMVGDKVSGFPDKVVYQRSCGVMCKHCADVDELAMHVKLKDALASLNMVALIQE